MHINNIKHRTYCKMRVWNFAVKIALYVVIGALLCEYLIYHLVTIQCTWPELKAANMENKDTTLRAFFIADTHLLGSREGHWFDKLRREWQMERSFQSAMTWLRPDAVFVLGDLTDEGKWASDGEFDATIQRFWKMFYHHGDVEFHIVAGNHDMGFHDYVSEKLRRRFDIKFKSSSVKIITIKGNTFVLVNSMTMHLDRCTICSPATEELRRASMQLNCSRYGSPNGATSTSSPSKVSQKCKNFKSLPPGRPILLQHFPLYRESDATCTGVDAAPPDERYVKFRQGWDTLPKDASKRLLSWIQPRLVLSGHTHHGCSVRHGNDDDNSIPEVSVPSFSWRNRNNPSVVLVTMTNGDFEISKCFLPEESMVIMMYTIWGLILVLWIFVRICRPSTRLLGMYGLAKLKSP